MNAKLKFLLDVLRAPGNEPDSLRNQLSSLSSLIEDLPAIKLNLKNFGYELGRRLAAELPPLEAGAGPFHVGLTSKPTTQRDMEAPWVRYWLAQLHVPMLFHRKFWELAYVPQALHEAGVLREGARGLGFGCGEEPLPAMFAARGIDILATDLPPDQVAGTGWAETSQHAATLNKLFLPYLVDRATFDARVKLRHLDMNAIPDDLTGFDFCWSVCAFEHLGSIQKGLDFVRNAMRTLRPGGVAVHTTEYNHIDVGRTLDHGSTVIFQRAHFEALAETLRADGCIVDPLDFNVGDGPLDRFIDLPPFQPGADPWLPHEQWAHVTADAHLKLSLAGIPATCYGLIVRKGGQ